MFWQLEAMIITLLRGATFVECVHTCQTSGQHIPEDNAE